jgi:hypothetical protein
VKALVLRGEPDDVKQFIFSAVFLLPTSIIGIIMGYFINLGLEYSQVGSFAAFPRLFRPIFLITVAVYGTWTPKEASTVIMWVME